LRRRRSAAPDAGAFHEAGVEAFGGDGAGAAYVEGVGDLDAPFGEEPVGSHAGAGGVGVPGGRFEEGEDLFDRGLFVAAGAGCPPADVVVRFEDRHWRASKVRSGRQSSHWQP
jgi:hypothetical protein